MNFLSEERFEFLLFVSQLLVFSVVHCDHITHLLYYQRLNAGLNSVSLFVLSINIHNWEVKSPSKTCAQLIILQVSFRPGPGSP